MKENAQRALPLFCVDVTEDDDNEQVSGREFITREIPTPEMDAYNEEVEAYDAAVEKQELPLVLRIVKYACGFFAAVVLLGSIKAGGIDKALQNAPILVLVGAVCGVAWALLFIYSKYKHKRVAAEERTDERREELKAESTRIYEELSVPKDAAAVDVLMFRFEEKDGAYLRHKTAIEWFTYFNFEMKVYTEGEDVHFADLGTRHTFHRADFRAIRTVYKRVSISGWNKEDAPRSDKYKPYKLTVNNIGMVFFKSYHILELEREGRLYGIYFPCYELPVFEKLTGLTAEE